MRIVNMGELFAYDVINGQDMKRLRMSESEMAVSGLDDGDLLFGRRSLVEAGAGKCSLVEGLTEPTTFESSIIRVRVDQTRARPRFLFYWLKSPQGAGRIRGIVTGTNVKGIRGSVLKTIEVTCPPVEVQDSLVQVIRCYDDLIENNTRRIKLLEDAARLLYEEWFVRLRFPGNEHTPIRDGVPKGWEHKPTPEAIDINPTTRLSDAKEHWWVEMSDLPLNSMVVQGTVLREGRSGSKFQNGDTLFARITPCLENGKTAFVDFLPEGVTARGSTEFIVLRSKRLSPEFVYCLARTYAFRHNAIKSMIGASGRQRVQDSCFDKFMVNVPPPTLLTAFTDIVRPIFRHIRALHLQATKAREARDLLLPRLMSGEVAV
ncbi:MAG: restriction endonuclease subunit S [Phycisphaerales bacterium]|nr:restriction endonuclease subunit S [Phycisphaerales bacterium]